MSTRSSILALAVLLFPFTTHAEVTAVEPTQIAACYHIDSLANLRWVSENSSSWTSCLVQTKDIDASETSGWNSGAGFSPIGNQTTAFAGHYFGRNHVIRGLYINRSDDFVGFFGDIGNGSVDSLGLVDNNVTSTGTYFVGGIAGRNGGTILNTYTTGNVSSPKAEFVGGVVGESYNSAHIAKCYNTGNVVGQQSVYVGGVAGQNYSSYIDSSYNTGNITGDTALYLGGVTGFNQGPLTNSYNTGNVIGVGVMDLGGVTGFNASLLNLSYNTGSVTGSESMYVAGGVAGDNVGGGGIYNSYNTGNVTISSNAFAGGGMVGENENGGTIAASYSAGHVSASGSAIAGGVAGSNAGSVYVSFWNQDSVSSDNGTGTGLTTSQMLTTKPFSDAIWDFTNIWAQYEGHTYPLLRTFMDTLTVTAKDTTKIYDGKPFSGDNGFTYSLPGAAALVFGTSVDTGSSQGAKYPGNGFEIKPSGLWSTQLGYLISYGTGILTISPKPISLTGVTANKIYDGTTSASLTGTPSFAGVVLGDSVTVTGSLVVTFADKNAGLGKPVTVTGYDVGGRDKDHYTLNPTTLFADITPLPITITGVTASDKVYDGTTSATLSGGTFVDAIAGDLLTINSGTGAFADANVGTAKPVTASGYSITGADVNNYTLSAQPTSLTASITPKTIHIAANTDTIAFGATTPTLTYVADSLLASDSFTGALAREVGDTAGTYAILIGTLSAGGNYTIDFASANLVIQASTVAPPEAIKSSLGIAFTGRTSASVFNLQGKQVWSGSLDVINGHVKMPSIGEGRWVVKLQMGNTTTNMNTIVHETILIRAEP